MDRTPRNGWRCGPQATPQGKLVGSVVVVIVVVVCIRTEAATVLQTLTALAGLATSLLAIPGRTAWGGTGPAEA